MKDAPAELASGDNVDISDKESDGKMFLSPSEEPPIPSTQRSVYSRHESVPKVSFMIGTFFVLLLFVVHVAASYCTMTHTHTT